MEDQKETTKQQNRKFPQGHRAITTSSGTGLSRRDFMSSAAVAAAAAISTTVSRGQNIAQSSNRPKFKLKYAPHFEMFKHHVGGDLIDQLNFMADEGFTAMEDNWMRKRPKDMQEKIARQMRQLGMTMGIFIAYGDGEFDRKTFVTNDKSIREMLIKRMKAAVEIARRINAKWATVVLCAYDNGIELDYQTANVIENLKWCAEVCEPAGLIMVIEPLNPWRNHPGLFLARLPQAYQICCAVNSPSCKILDDLYHQQITEGNLIPNIDMAWDQIAYFQTGDNPGLEPTTGEINYKNIFKHLYNKGYKGVIGMEHGNSKPGKEGERAVIEAYRICDSF